MINISDSILIWTSHGQPSAFFDIVLAVSTILGISMIQGLPLRGFITRQKFSVKKYDAAVTSIIGRGVVHAYKQEGIQQWSGCIVDKEILHYYRDVEKKFGHIYGATRAETEELVLPYDVL